MKFPKPKKHKKLTYKKTAAWTNCSLYIRRRDALKMMYTIGGEISSEYARCVTCGKPYHIKLLDAGHCVQAYHSATMFDPRNINAQCTKCNHKDYLAGNYTLHGIEVEKMWGREIFDYLRSQAPLLFSYTRDQIKAISKVYLKGLKDLDYAQLYFTNRTSLLAELKRIDLEIVDKIEAIKNNQYQGGVK